MHLSFEFNTRGVYLYSYNAYFRSTAFVEDARRCTLKDQVNIRRKHAGNPVWSSEAEAALASLALVPPIRMLL